MLKRIMLKSSNLRLLPLLVVVAALSFGVRFGEFVTGVSQAPGSANAQESINAQKKKMEEMEQEMLKDGDTMPDQSVFDNPADIPMAEAQGERINWRDSSEVETENTTLSLELFEDLKERRKEIESQKRELAVREALLKTAEQEIDQKYEELVSLREEIQELLVQQTDEEKKRIASLVKIYEGMKPKDAARIFNTLDLDILLDVVSRMSERKSAPIIAAMTAERARSLTIMLAEQKKLGAVSMIAPNVNLNQ